MIDAPIPGTPWILIGSVRGLVEDARQVVRRLHDRSVAWVGLGLAPEELDGLDRYFVRSGAEPVVPLTLIERSEVKGLTRFGEVRIPNPTFVESLAWCRSSGVPVAPLDPSEDRTAEIFTESIGYVELVRRTVRERSLSRRPPAPSSADEYALEWEARVTAGQGSRRYHEARDRHLIAELRRAAPADRSAAVVVDRERFERIRDLWSADPP
ncbi:MAG: hypothetical protein ACYCPN_01355 [Thermoplasmata archaeon]